MPDDDPQHTKPTEIGDIDPAVLLARAMTPPPAAEGWTPPSLDALHRALPQYEIIELAGRGAMGAVYKGWQKSLDRHVAIKVLPAEMGARDPDFAARFKREAKAMARLSHPGIVAVYDAGETSDGLLYFIMDYIEGTDVQKLVETQGRLAPAQALAIAAQVCDALAYAHGKGVIHRDIKPSNVMLDAEGRVKVADFGLAKFANAESGLLTATDLSVGTPAFMAPESLGGAIHADHRADLYAVGVMLYQMLTGQLPRGRFEMPSGVVAQVDPRYDTIVDKALQADREKRYAAASDMKRDLDAIAQPSPAPAAPASRPPGKWLAAAAAVVIGVGGWFLWNGREQPAPEAAGLAASPSPPVSKSPTLSPSTEPWVDALAKHEDIVLVSAQITAQGLQFAGQGQLKVKTEKGPRRDGAVRMKTAFEPAALGLHLRVRCTLPSDNGHYTLALRDAGTAELRRVDILGKTGGTLAQYALPAPLKPGQEYTMELRAEGAKLTARLNGAVLGQVEDTVLTEGQFGVGNSGTTPALVKALEYLDLGGGTVSPSPGPQVSKSPTLSPSTEPWVDALADKSRLYIKDAEITPQGLRFTGFGNVGIDRGPKRDGAVRILTTFDPARKEQVHLRARSTEKESAHYRLIVSGGNTAVLSRWDGVAVSYHPIGQFPLPAPLQPGQDYEMELRILGSKLTAKFNGKVLGEAGDSTIAEGRFGVASTADGTALVKALEYLDLDGGARPPGAPPAPFVGGVYQLTPGQWMKVFNTEAELRAPTPPLVFTLRDGWIDFSSRTKGQEARIPGSKGRNRGIRLHGKVVAGADPLNGFVLKLRQTPLLLDGSPTNGFATYMLGLRGIADTTHSVNISHYHGPSGKTDVLGSIPVGSPLAPGAEFDLEFFTIGDQLIARFNGKPLPVVTDTRLTEGYMVIQTGHLIRDVEVLNLDGLSEAEARKAAGLPASPGP